MGPELRAAVVGDAGAIAGVQVRSWQAAYAHLLPPEWLASMSVDERTAVWARSIAAGEPCVAVAEVAGRTVGFVAFGPSRDKDAAAATHEVWALYLEPADWSTGLGRRLLGHALAAMQAAGAASVSLWAIVGNARAARFYERAGLRCDAGSRADFEIAGVALQEDRYVLELGNNDG